jgi:signal transduction histidine kinase
MINDDNRFKQVLINLISNALKFTFTGGVEIRAKYIRMSKFLIIQVKDTGMGMSKEDQ